MLSCNSFACAKYTRSLLKKEKDKNTRKNIGKHLKPHIFDVSLLHDVYIWQAENACKSRFFSFRYINHDTASNAKLDDATLIVLDHNSHNEVIRFLQTVKPHIHYLLWFSKKLYKDIVHYCHKNSILLWSPEKPMLRHKRKNSKQLDAFIILFQQQNTLEDMSLLRDEFMHEGFTVLALSMNPLACLFKTVYIYSDEYFQRIASCIETDIILIDETIPEYIPLEWDISIKKSIDEFSVVSKENTLSRFESISILAKAIISYFG